jgi:outer membrane protein OmpA-like peptidoglycan-associated protein
MTASRSAGSARALRGALLCALGATAAAPAAAQSFEVNRFRPAPLVRDGFAVDGADTSGHLKLDAALNVDYARAPLKLLLANGDDYSVIAEQLALHASVALGLSERAAIFAGAPLNLVMEGNEPPAGISTRLPPADDAGLGDAHAGLRVRLLGTRDDAAMLGLQVVGFFPLASVDDSQLYSGDDGLGVEQQLLFQLNLGVVAVRANAGVRFRPEQSLPSVEIGNELTYGLGAEVGLAERRLRLIADAFGASFLDDLGGDAESPVELLFGLKYKHDAGFHFGLAAGPGINAGVGTPELRGVATLGMASPERRDRDGDGLEDDADQCPRAAEDKDGFGDHDGCPDADNDGDGIADAADRCILQPEDADRFEDRDGCPDLDNDKDGIADRGDRCPGDPEDTDDFEDQDGCPDPDNDGDGRADHEDDCPSDAEDADGHEDGNGCPDPDNDRDGVPDESDRCPNDPGDAADQGCPKVRVDESKGTIEILERVEFAPGKDVILAISEGLLQQVKAAIEQHPEIARVRIEGHTDSVGKDARNLQLSKRRARSVVRWLVNAGVGAQRMEAVGCGETRPIADNESDDGRQTNRRVEFHIIDPAPDSPRSLAGCEPIDL